MLLKIIYSYFSLMNLAALSNKLRNLLAEKFPDQAIIISLLRKMDQAQQTALQAIGSSTKQALTATVRSADTIRDNSFISLRTHVYAGLRREHKGYREACETLWPLFEKNNIKLYNLADGEETAAIGSLLKDLKAGDFPAHLATVNATEWLDELERDNIAFVAVQQQRAAKRGSDNTVVDEEAFKQLKAALELIGSAIDSLQLLELDGVKAVAAEINEYIREANANARNSKNRPRR